MKIVKDTLWKEILECMTDPVSDILLNFSIEKSRKGYEDRKKQWESGSFRNNPAVKKEEVSFAFADLYEGANQFCQANNMYNNLKKEDFNKGVDWYMCGQNIVVSWYRLKTFDEWLHDGLKDALTMAAECPEDGARMIIERKLGEGKYTNTAIHMYIEGKINDETLKRLGQYEKYKHIEDRNMEKDIEEAMKILKENEGKKDVTVLTLKM